MSIVLFLFGFFGVFVISSSSIANSFKENFSISIFFKENAKQIEVSELQNQLLMSDYLEKLTYVSKENAVLIMKEEYGEDFIKDLGYNPLVNSIDINLKSKYVETIKIDSISEIIKTNKYVDEIVYDKNLITLINENIKNIYHNILVPLLSILAFSYLCYHHSAHVFVIDVVFLLLANMKIMGLIAELNLLHQPLQLLLLLYLLHGIPSGICYHLVARSNTSCLPHVLELGIVKQHCILVHICWMQLKFEIFGTLL